MTQIIEYQGYCFTQKIDVRWAKFFDYLRIKWEYNASCRSFILEATRSNKVYVVSLERPRKNHVVDSGYFISVLGLPDWGSPVFTHGWSERGQVVRPLLEIRGQFHMWGEFEFSLFRFLHDDFGCSREMVSKAMAVATSARIHYSGVMVYADR